MFAEIISHVPKPLTYRVPTPLSKKIKVGQIVRIPLGKTEKNGIVIGFTQKTNLAYVKDIKEIIFEKPFLVPHQIELAKWASVYYLSSIGKIIKFMLPENLEKINSKKYEISSDYNDSIKKEEQKPILFYTNSKKLKWEYYLKEIRKNHKNKKQTLLILPEIYPSFSEINKLKKEFGNKALVYQSNINQKRKFWQKIRNDSNFDIIIGSHSAFFLPFKNLGLIICDEEQSKYYKQDQAPHYNLRDLSLKLSKIIGAKIILGSFSPSEESYYKAKNKLFTLIKKKEKRKKNIQLVDINELSYLERTISPILKANLDKILATEKQAILFFNRKGTARAINCPDCGYTIKCPSCKLPISYSVSEKAEMICHRCKIKIDVPETCPVCRSLFIRTQGTGIQKIVADLKKFYPLTEIEYIDKDLDEKTLNNHILDFINKKIKILVGTQFILNLPLPQIDFLGIISADSEFSLPSFNAEEKTIANLFDLSLLLKNNGKLILQTANSESAAIKFFITDNLEKFYETDFVKRKSFHYPPFYKIIKLECKDKSPTKCQREAENVYKDLLKLKNQTSAKIDIGEPAPAFIPRVRKIYRWQILIKYLPKYEKETATLLSILPSTWSIDKDPENTL